MLGATWVPTNFRLTPPEVAYLATSSGASVHIFDDAFPEHAAAAKAAEAGTLTKEQERGMSKEQKEAFEKNAKAREAQLAKNKALNEAYTNGKNAVEGSW